MNPKLDIFIILPMGKQLARSKIDSKFLNYLALFVRVFHPTLFACKIPYFLLPKHCIPSILIDPESTGFSTIDKYQKPHVFGSKVIYNIYKDLLRALRY